MTIEVMRYKLNELRMMLNDGEHTEEQGILVDIIKELDKVENKGDLISRQAVINAIANTCFWLSADNWKELIKCINSIQPVENKGEWIYKNPFDTVPYCSKCGKEPNTEFLGVIPETCPNCGADMRGDKPNE